MIISEYANSFVHSDIVFIYYSKNELKRKNIELFKPNDI